jgi:hypothetical protein
MLITIIKAVIVAFVLFIIFGIIFSLFTNIPHFPYDMFYIKRNFTFYFPVITCGILAGIITIILWFSKKI